MVKEKGTDFAMSRNRRWFSRPSGECCFLSSDVVPGGRVLVRVVGGNWA